MKKVYTTPFALTAHMVRELLEDNEIKAVVQNDSILLLAGSVPWQHTWPSVWVKDADEAAALELLKNFGKETTGKEEGEGRTCPVCGEKINAQFGGCWKCAAAGQAEAQAQDISAFNRARRGLVAALLITLCASYSFIFAGSSRKASRLIGHFTPYQMFGALVFAIGAVLSLYFIGQVFETSRSTATEKNVPHSRWLSDAAIRSRRGLMFALLASWSVPWSVPLLLSFFHRWLPSSWQGTIFLLLCAVPQLFCYYFIVRAIIAAKHTPTKTENPTQENQAK